MHESIAPDPVHEAITTADEATESRSSATPDIFSPPQPPPGYEIVRVIGQGGMGTVYAARDIALDRSVALKFLQERLAGSELAGRRFLYEARVTARLQHPGIPPVHQVGKLPDGRPFLAMKLIHGQTLDRLIKEQGPGAARWLGVFEAICQAVGYAHSQGVIHRDLKPGNVMVGAFGEVQVMDWGLAKLLGQRGQVEAGDAEAMPAEAVPLENQTQAGTILGTPTYMPPEQAIGAIDRLDCRSDVFGLGAILCTLLTGKPPYQGTSAEAVRQLAAQGKLEEAFARLDTCGAEPELLALAKRCLAFEPEERPADAGALATAVGELRRAAEARARAAELDRAQAEVRAAEQRKRRRVVLLASCGLVLVLSGGIVGTLREYWRAETARQNEQTQREQAEEARDQAKQRYLLALEAFHDMVFDIQNQLENRPGTLALRKRLLGKARAGLDRLLVEAVRQGNPDRTLIYAHVRMGDVELLLGNTEPAHQQFQTSHDLAAKLLETDPDDRDLQRDLGLIFERLGSVTLQLGQTQKALDHFQKARAITQRLVSTDPTDVEAQRDLSTNLTKLAEAMLQKSETQEALNFLRQGLEIRQRRVLEDPKNPQAQRDLSVSFSRLGDVTLRLGKVREARDFYQKAHAIDQHLAAVDPRDGQIQRDLGISFNRLGDVTQRLGQTQEALGYYRKGHEIDQRRVAEDPRNAQAQRDLSISYERMGNITLEMGQPQEALRLYQSSLEIRQRRAVEDPRDGRTLRDLSVSFNLLGDVTQRLGQPQKALGYFQKAYEINQKRVADDPSNVVAQNDLSASLSELGNITLELGQAREALGFYQKAHEIDQRLAAANPQDAEAQRDLSIGMEKLGNVHMRLDQPQQALSYYQKAHEIRQRQVVDDSRDRQTRRAVCISFTRLGNVHLQLGQPEKALGFFQSGLKIAERLAAEDPRHEPVRFDLFILHYKMGAANLAAHQYAPAVDWLIKTQAMVEAFRTEGLVRGPREQIGYLTVQQWEAELRECLARCETAEKVLARLDFALAQKAEQVGPLLDLRLRALLAQRQVGEAIKTAECWRDWAEREKAKDVERYNVACAFALCAAADRGTRRESLMRQCVALLKHLRESGYFRDEKRRAHFAQDADFAGVREHPDIVAFTQTLAP
ncbi:MAG: tetratricopeptide repeat protein [Gemmataceae bacterium]